MARLQGEELTKPHRAQTVLRALVAAIHVTPEELRIELRPSGVGLEADGIWTWHMPLPARKPVREAKLRLDVTPSNDRYDSGLVALLAEAMEVQRLVLAAPELSLNQLGKREGRCRTHLSRLLRLSWLSPRIVEADVSGTQPKSMTRKLLLSAPIPLEWEAQERQFGLAA